MANDYYPTDESGPAEAGEGMEGSERGADSGVGETTLVPKSMFQGKELKPGDEFYFTVVRVHENEVEVSYSKGGGGEEKAEAETPEGAFDAKFSMMGGGGAGGGGGY